jgi:hypothetical protein
MLDQDKELRLLPGLQARRIRVYGPKPLQERFSVIQCLEEIKVALNKA